MTDPVWPSSIGIVMMSKKDREGGDEEGDPRRMGLNRVWESDWVIEGGKETVIEGDSELTRKLVGEGETEGVEVGIDGGGLEFGVELGEEEERGGRPEDEKIGGGEGVGESEMDPEDEGVSLGEGESERVPDDEGVSLREGVEVLEPERVLVEVGVGEGDGLEERVEVGDLVGLLVGEVVREGVGV